MAGSIVIPQHLIDETIDFLTKVAVRIAKEEEAEQNDKQTKGA